MTRARIFLAVLLLLATASARPILDATDGQIKEAIDIIRSNDTITIKLSEKNYITINRGYDPKKCYEFVENLTQNGIIFFSGEFDSKRCGGICDAIGAGPIFMAFNDLSFDQARNLTDDEIAARVRGLTATPNRSVSVVML